MRIIAGSCSIENYDQAISLAGKLKALGVSEIRAMLFKPRTDPSSFQGIGYDGIEILKELKNMGFKIVSEVMNADHIEKLYDYVDSMQVGARNMQNFDLLRELGRTDKNIILKRGFASYIEEWIKASEYITRAGNENVTLCERGIRSFDNITRNVLDIGAIIYLKEMTDFEVLADPSHSMGRRDLVPGAAKAAMAAGADGLIIEVHENPDEALTDKDQALDIKTFEKLLKELDGKYNL